jgi:single-strand DNA-binding protein
MSNVFSFTGSLGGDAELKNVNGQDLLNFAVANSVGFGDKKTTLWVDATLWGQRAVKAAPDLLEALIACDEAMEYMSEYDIPITLPQQVKDAITKATGGTR